MAHLVGCSVLFHLSWELLVFKHSWFFVHEWCCSRVLNFVLNMSSSSSSNSGGLFAMEAVGAALADALPNVVDRAQSHFELVVDDLTGYIESFKESHRDGVLQQDVDCWLERLTKLAAEVNRLNQGLNRIKERLMRLTECVPMRRGIEELTRDMLRASSSLTQRAEILFVDWENTSDGVVLHLNALERPVERLEHAIEGFADIEAAFTM
jgi:hypothetical protein